MNSYFRSISIGIQELLNSEMETEYAIIYFWVV